MRTPGGNVIAKNLVEMSLQADCCMMFRMGRHPRLRQQWRLPSRLARALAEEAYGDKKQSRGQSNRNVSEMKDKKPKKEATKKEKKGKKGKREDRQS